MPKQKVKITIDDVAYEFNVSSFYFKRERIFAADVAKMPEKYAAKLAALLEVKGQAVLKPLPTETLPAADAPADDSVGDNHETVSAKRKAKQPKPDEENV